MFHQVASGQIDSIYDQGVYRTFILHLPEGYNENIEYPVVLNLHGLGSNAFEQQLYSQFDAIADEEGFIVLYVDAINNSWDLFGNTDVTFLSNLIDTIRENYSTNNCLFSMGMSQGGFLSYKLACELPQNLTAMAIVTGNMLEAWQITCSVPEGMPVMHFHGTADQVVNYNGSFGISPVEETVQWWAMENNCNVAPAITELPDINLNDGSSVEEYKYSGCMPGTEVILYKVTNGGHTWPGAFPIQSLGNTNQDINASAIIGNFFEGKCTEATGIHSASSDYPVLIYPNPATQTIKFEWQEKEFDLEVFDVSGRIIFERKKISERTEVICSAFKNGIYYAYLKTVDGLQSSKKFILSN